MNVIYIQKVLNIIYQLKMQQESHQEEMDIQSQPVPDNKITPQTDHRIPVAHTQLSVFPYNCIVSIQFKEKFPQNQENVNNVSNATGFLISSDLVLTSSHNFLRVDEEKNQIIQLIPFSLKCWQIDEKGMTLHRQIKKINNVKTNQKYFLTLNRIVLLKSMVNNEDKNKQLKVILQEKILPLELESIKYDFALIKLEEDVKRQTYFLLCPDLRDKIQATVTGYEEINNLETQMFTHFNKVDSINDEALFYDIDASKSQRGSPVYIIEENQIKTVGIHKAFSRNKHLSYATMISNEMIKVLREWANEINSSFEVINANRPIISGQNQQENNPLQSMSQRQQDRLQQEQRVKKQEADRVEQQKRIQKALLYNTRGIQCYQHGNFYQALQYYRRSLYIYQRTDKKSLSWAATLHNMGLVNYRENKLNQALKYYEASLKMRQSLNESKSIDFADTLYNMGIVYKKQDAINKSLDCSLKSLKIKQDLKGCESIDCVNSLNSIGRIYDILGNFPFALEYFHRQLSIREVINGKGSIDCISVLQCIAIIYKKMNEHEKATEFWQRAVQIKSKNK